MSLQSFSVVSADCTVCERTTTVMMMVMNTGPRFGWFVAAGSFSSGNALRQILHRKISTVNSSRNILSLDFLRQEFSGRFFTADFVSDFCGRFLTLNFPCHKFHGHPPNYILFFQWSLPASLFLLIFLPTNMDVLCTPYAKLCAHKRVFTQNI